MTDASAFGAKAQKGNDMSSKHTPGPWKWSNLYLTLDGRPTWSLIGNGGYGILSCDGDGNSPQGLGPTGAYNASLIAAAPDLLEALRNTRSLLSAFVSTEYGDSIAIVTMAQADAAIAKAGG